MLRCRHCRIASFHHVDTWLDAGTPVPYSLEEFLSGGTLAKRLERGRLSPAALHPLGAKLIDAVSHVAAHDLVHRDIKPDNIMFRDGTTDDPVLVDFGLVRDLSQDSLTKTWLMRGPGTPFFAPPEQLNNEKSLIDWRADQFSLGVVLAICGTGSHPFAPDGASPESVVDRVAQRESPGSDFANWTSAVGLEPLLRMVAPWPVERYRTPADLAAAWGAAGASA
jgi:serine/threonine protein kinase